MRPPRGKSVRGWARTQAGRINGMSIAEYQLSLLTGKPADRLARKIESMDGGDRGDSSEG